MNIGRRVFIVEGDAVISMSQKNCDAFYLREEPVLPQFASRTIQIAVGLYTLEARKPKQVIRIESMRLKVRDDGSIDRDRCLQRPAFGRQPDWENTEGASAWQNILDAKARFDQRNWEPRHTDIPRFVQKRILEVLFGWRHAIQQRVVDRHRRLAASRLARCGKPRTLGRK